MLLDGRVAIVTGGGRGLGREFALCLARYGAAVVVNDNASSVDGRSAEGDPAAEVCAEITEAGGRAIASRESVTDFEGAKAMVEAATEAFGQLDILVNNAGNIRNSLLVDMSEEDFDAVVSVHLKGTFNVTRHAAPVMREQRYGRIINITSEGGIQGQAAHTNYAAAKSGIVGMTYVWALELAEHGITVNALAPQGETRMTKPQFQRRGNSGRAVANPALNAPMVAFLASERSAHVNGQVFGRQGYAFTIFRRSQPLASMWRSGLWEPGQIAHQFDQVLGRHLQPVSRADIRFDRNRPK